MEGVAYINERSGGMFFHVHASGGGMERRVAGSS